MPNTTPLFAFLWCCFFAIPILGSSEQVAPRSDTCIDPKYEVHVFSKTPLVIYISDFLTEAESEHLQEITQDSFSHSAVSDESGTQGQRSTRTSQSASVVRDPIVRCIENRALKFQGFDTPRTHLEPLQLVKYSQNQQYHLHTDWFEAESQITNEFGGNRESSFFVYVKSDNVTGGGTNFPMLEAPRDERWCGFVDCDEAWDNGVTFRPLRGSAVFWQNLGSDGMGDPATLHAGLPVTHGEKIGMNIWTRQWPLSEEYRGVNDENEL
ncbi:2OG-Fe(II) oxygenase superfamily protein [Amylocarpus encephaloides]|uniref:2OG-Fe(II) oxygenase superfamily protein n=1 Tax=Amylocarpus encephaloides TaxID=45428 RepID=A0A9P8CBZ8_9HELO|nr:2OG-Fe(II) oxygenase superfamily protein [Amylocarpus encephaloides]